MKRGTEINYFLHQTIEVREAPVAGKTYNAFSRPCKDTMPHPSVPVFSQGKDFHNEKLDKIKLD